MSTKYRDTRKGMPAGALTLPAKYYTDPEIYRRELESIHYRSWLCAGRAEELPEAGSYFVRRVGEGRRHRLAHLRLEDRVQRRGHGDRGEAGTRTRRTLCSRQDASEGDVRRTRPTSTVLVTCVSFPWSPTLITLNDSETGVLPSR